MKSNVCYIASAGAGKTTKIVELLVQRATEIGSTNKKIAVITYTDKNQEVIKDRICKKYGCTPSNILVLGWFEYLLKYWINPYKGDVIPSLYNKHIGILPVDIPSGLIRDKNGKFFFSYKKNELEKKYLTPDMRKIFSDKLSEYAIECLNKNNPNLLKRIDNIFDSIFFDEVQDFAGYDFEVIKNIIKSCSLWCVLTGDPRQHTFSTHISRKYKGYEGQIDRFIKDEINTKRKTFINVDYNTLIYSHRCVKEICDFSSIITPDYPQTKQCNCKECVERRNSYEGLTGCYLLRKKDLNIYLNNCHPIALTWNRKINIHTDIKERFNFGECKGGEWDSVIIFCTKSMEMWMKNPYSNFTPEARAKFYVAVTRARYCTIIVVPNNFVNSVINIPFWSPK